jgi:hypothetical protein
MVIFPVWLTYDPIIHGTSRKPLSHTGPMLAACLPSVFGLRWLGYRYAAIIARKHPITTDLRFGLALAFLIPSLIWVMFVVKVLLT